MGKLFESLPCLQMCTRDGRNRNGYESAAVSISLNTLNAQGNGATKHLLQRRVSSQNASSTPSV